MSAHSIVAYGGFALLLGGILCLLAGIVALETRRWCLIYGLDGWSAAYYRRHLSNYLAAVAAAGLGSPWPRRPLPFGVWFIRWRLRQAKRIGDQPIPHRFYAMHARVWRLLRAYHKGLSAEEQTANPWTLRDRVSTRPLPAQPSLAGHLKESLELLRISQTIFMEHGFTLDMALGLPTRTSVSIPPS